jgi:hypothetical protein
MIASMLIVPHHVGANIFSALGLGPSASADALIRVSEVHILLHPMILFITSSSASSIVGTRADPDLLLLLIIVRGFFVEALVDLRQRLRDPTAL